MTTVLVTGAFGFIGRNLCVRLDTLAGVETIALRREAAPGDLENAVARADVVFHLAGVNRPTDEREFEIGNATATQHLCDLLLASGRHARLVLSSSTQAPDDTPYGRSKKAAEEAAMAYGHAAGAPVHVLRLPNVFGKWARPNYNSAVATFCHNTVHAIPLTIHDPARALTLVYIDDVIDRLVALIGPQEPIASGFLAVEPQYDTTVGEMAELIRSFPKNRDTLVVPPTGHGLVRALYATYLSHLTPPHFAYDVPVHGRNDTRGIFVEMLRTDGNGQMSYFVAKPGVTRGGHYHHTKNEKFMVLTGRARFGFRHILTDERYELEVEGGEGRIVETIPGWAHNITNVGDDDMLCMLWANELFDPARPDTIAARV